VLASTVATAAFPVVHEPPLVALLNDVTDPTHTFIVPVIVAGKAFTVTTAVVLQPAE
jgi:hypothetical protein